MKPHRIVLLLPLLVCLFASATFGQSFKLTSGLSVDGSGNLLINSAATGGVVQTTLTSGLKLDSNGYLLVDVAVGGGGGSSLTPSTTNAIGLITTPTTEGSATAVEITGVISAGGLNCSPCSGYYLPFFNSSGTTLSYLAPSNANGFLQNSGSGPVWDGNLTDSAGTLLYNGIVQATQFVATGPWQVVSPDASALPSCTSSETTIAVGTSANNGALYPCYSTTQAFNGPFVAQSTQDTTTTHACFSSATIGYVTCRAIATGDISSVAVNSFSGDGVLLNNSSSTGAVTDALVSASAHKFFGNNTGSSASPVYETLGSQDVTPALFIAGAGTAQAQTATLSPAVTSLVTGLLVEWTPTAANTGGGPTLAVNGLTATTITKCGASALVAGDLATSTIAQAVYDGTEFQLLNPQATPCTTNSLLKSGTYAAQDTVYAVGAGSSMAASANLKVDSTNEGHFATYNAETTAGVGLAYERGVTSQKSETGSADSSVLAVTPASAVGTYRVCYTASVSSATSGVIGFTLSWTDSNGNAQSNIALSLFQGGTAAPALTFTTSAAGDYGNCFVFDVNSGAAAITLKWVGGGTTAAKVSAAIEREQ